MLPYCASGIQCSNCPGNGHGSQLLEIEQSDFPTEGKLGTKMEMECRSFLGFKSQSAKQLWLGQRLPLQLAPLWLFLVCCGRIDLGSACACGQSGIKNNRWNGAAGDCKGLKLEEACSVSHTFIVRVDRGSESLTFTKDSRLGDSRAWQVAPEQLFPYCSVTWKHCGKCCFDFFYFLFFVLLFGYFLRDLWVSRYCTSTNTDLMMCYLAVKI